MMGFLRRLFAKPECAPKVLYAREGETITCQNGHAICTFARTIYRSDPHDATIDFTNWTQPVPERGSFPVCTQCRAQFWDSRLFSNIYHFPEGWRNNGNHYKTLDDCRKKDV